MIKVNYKYLLIYQILLLCTLCFVTHAVEVQSSTAEEQLVISRAWARQSMSAGGNSAVYLVIKNNTNTDYKLIGASALDITDNIELHNSFVDQIGISRMAKIDNIAIPAQSTITLAPGAMHIMLFRLRKKLMINDKFDLRLLFENTNPQSVEVIVKSGN